MDQISGLLYNLFIDLFFFLTFNLLLINQNYLNLVTKWWIIIRASSLASSLPGQACTPLPNGMKVFGFGETCINK